MNPIDSSSHVETSPIPPHYQPPTKKTKIALSANDWDSLPDDLLFHSISFLSKSEMLKKRETSVRWARSLIEMMFPFQWHEGKKIARVKYYFKFKYFVQSADLIVSPIDRKILLKSYEFFNHSIDLFTDDKLFELMSSPTHPSSPNCQHLNSTSVVNIPKSMKTENEGLLFRGIIKTISSRIIPLLTITYGILKSQNNRSICISKPNKGLWLEKVDDHRIDFAQFDPSSESELTKVRIRRIPRQLKEDICTFSNWKMNPHNHQSADSLVKRQPNGIVCTFTNWERNANYESADSLVEVRDSNGLVRTFTNWKMNPHNHESADSLVEVRDSDGLVRTCTFTNWKMNPHNHQSADSIREREPNGLVSTFTNWERNANYESADSLVRDSNGIVRTFTNWKMNPHNHESADSLVEVRDSNGLVRTFTNWKQYDQNHQTADSLEVRKPNGGLVWTSSYTNWKKNPDNHQSADSMVKREPNGSVVETTLNWKTI